jgi:hypothetical protein
MKDEFIELKHIQLEIKNNRGQHLRHFIDQYFCYKNNYVTKSGKASWGKITWKEFVSFEANKISDKKLVVEKEHIVPLIVIKEKLLELGRNATIAAIAGVLDKYLMFATITKKEDKLLNANGLKQKMPKEFNDPKSELYQDLFSRYKIIGIKLIDKRINK